MKLPIDFEQKVKLPPAINGRSYPYQISARHLMDNFRYAALQVDQTEVSGISLIETTTPDGTRTVRISVNADSNMNSHPWKVSEYSTGSVEISPGFILGQFMTNTSSAWGSAPAGPDETYPPETVVLGFGANYSGGVEEISGTKYIYAEVPRNGATAVYSQSIGAGNDNVVVQLGDDIEPSSIDLAVIVTSDEPPISYTPTSGKAAVCIAKAVLVSDGIDITQYIHHNPTLFIPVTNIIVATNT